MGKVRSIGEIKCRGDTVYLSEAPRGEPIGLKPSDDRNWTIQFGPFIIGLLDDHTRRVVHTPTKVLPISPVAQGLLPLPLGEGWGEGQCANPGEAWAPTNSNRYTTNYLHRENVALGLVPS